MHKSVTLERLFLHCTFVNLCFERSFKIHSHHIERKIYQIQWGFWNAQPRANDYLSSTGNHYNVLYKHCSCHKTVNVLVISI